jgi:hypothetical protein
MKPPPCAGKWELFDSTDPHDHLKARALCVGCPMRVECAQLLEVARAGAHKAGPTKNYGPQGTWAGRLIGAGPHTSIERARAEEAMFTVEELRAGHNAYNAGIRTDRTRMAERIYQRKRARRRWREKKAAREVAA